MSEEAKEKGLKKIHGIGKACNILVRIMTIFCLIGFVAVLGFTIYLATRDDYAISFDYGTATTITLDAKAFGHIITEKEKEEMLASEDNGQMVFRVAGVNIDCDEIQVEDNTVILTSTDVYSAMGVRDIVAVMIALLVSIIISLVSLIFGGRLAKAFQDCESPFEGTVIKHMRAFAFSLFPWVFGRELFDSALYALLHSGGQINLTFDLTVLVVVLVVFAFVEIFRYGAVLQQESDETL